MSRQEAELIPISKFRIENATTRSEGGLGLAIAHRLVELHGGIGSDSVVDKGQSPSSYHSGKHSEGVGNHG